MRLDLDNETVTGALTEALVRAAAPQVMAGAMAELVPGVKRALVQMTIEWMTKAVYSARTGDNYVPDAERKRLLAEIRSELAGVPIPAELAPVDERSAAVEMVRELAESFDAEAPAGSKEYEIVQAIENLADKLEDGEHVRRAVKPAAKSALQVGIEASA